MQYKAPNWFVQICICDILLRKYSYKENILFFLRAQYIYFVFKKKNNDLSNCTAGINENY